MDRIRIRGGRRLEGEIPISGAKNAALKLMAASLLTGGPLTLSNVPRLADVRAMAELLKSFGVAIDVTPSAVLGEGAHEIRSGHHQAIDRVGDGLVVSALAPDGVIEAVELAGDTWVVGVQWHPEDVAADGAQLRALLDDFARAAVVSAPATA